jgi:deoxycytidylate deaminase
MRSVSSESPSTGENNIDHCKTEEQKKGFVSKERQLARLRERMAAEENSILTETQTRVVKQRDSVSLLPCRRCVDRVVAP